MYHCTASRIKSQRNFKEKKIESKIVKPFICLFLEDELMYLTSLELSWFFEDSNATFLF